MICFVHIEKAAGTTFCRILQNNYLSYISLTPWYYWSNDPDSVFSNAEAKSLFNILPFTKAFGGHTTRSYLSYEKVLNRKIHYITFLRNPVHRYLSMFNYQKSVMKINWDLEEYLSQTKFDNFITKRIAGSNNLNLAIKSMDYDYTFVGLTERFDESLLLMKHQLNLPNLCIFYEKLNTSLNSNYIDDILQNSRFVDRIFENNSLDIQLYEYAQKNIYKRYVGAYKRDLHQDLLNFRKQNINYKFTIFRRLHFEFYRNLIYKNLERFVKYIYHSNTN